MLTADLTFFSNVIDAFWDLVPFLQFKKRERLSWRILLLVKSQVLVYNFTKSETPPWVFFTFFKLYKWYQMTQRVSNTYYANYFTMKVFERFYTGNFLKTNQYV